jgi:hypothetical protein
MYVTYKVCLKSNETGAIKFFFIKNWTINQHCPLQSSSLGKPHAGRDVAPTAGSRAGSLHVEVPSTVLSRCSWSFLHFRNASVQHTHTLLAVKCDVLKYRAENSTEHQVGMYVTAGVWGVATVLPVVDPRIQSHYFLDQPCRWNCLHSILGN